MSDANTHSRKLREHRPPTLWRFKPPSPSVDIPALPRAKFATVDGQRTLPFDRTEESAE